MKIIWSPQAGDDLLTLYRYIAQENPRAARGLHSRIISRVLLLLKTPYSGRTGRVPGTRELVVSGTSYVVPYRIHQGSIQILRVYHTARLWPKSFD
jgi:addiction module RelE/StbE family toxin